MTTLTVKNIPEELHEELKQQAQRNRRSLNSEIIVCLGKALRSHRIDPTEILARLDSVRLATGHTPLTDEMVRQAREEGRP